MKYIKIFIAAILVLTLTACSDTSTAEVTETSAETEESITTVSEKTTETVSETDTLSAESEKTTVETSVESVESVSDTEAAEVVENTHWDTIVYDTTLEVDVTDWEVFDESTEYIVKPNTACTIAEAIVLFNIPDAVTAYLYENSSTYKTCFDDNEEIRGIVSGVKDFDSDGVDETFYAVNYLWYDWELSTVAGRNGALQSDIVVYDTADEKVYLCDTAADNYVTYVGCYFASDPAAECKSLDTFRYEEYFTWEGTDMYFTEDNIFISCNLNAMDIGYAYAYNHYNRLVYENGEYRVEFVGTAGWSLNRPPFAEGDDVPDCCRTASVTGDVPCVIK